LLSGVLLCNMLSMKNNIYLYIYEVSHLQIENNAMFFVSSTSIKKSKEDLDKILFHKDSPINGDLYDVKLITIISRELMQQSMSGSGVIGATTFDESTNQWSRLA